ncbi:MAG: hypothetical protein KA956_05790 [Pyrinomonadaceae bacterium]|nr:hypothetical protein [Acidobacteriota bacterium]MBP7375969.1 hypothetical protein [Pyrinomonadaceae bacterium]
MARVFSIIGLILLVVSLGGCVRDNPAILDEIAELGPFKDHSFYEIFEEQTNAGERGVYGYPKIVVVVRKGLTKEEREKVAWAYHKAHPKARIDFFDDESKLNEYIAMDKKPPNSPRDPSAVYDDGFISKHRVAQLMQTDKGEWFVVTEPYKGR